ncbi:MAG TPA: extracellular solute-binding protein [Candidatus Polarisedimenticolia bacterium]
MTKSSCRAAWRGLLVRAALLSLLASASACGPAGPAPPPEVAITVPRGGRVVVYVEAPRAIAGPILKTFTEQSGIEVQATYRESLKERFLPRLKEDAAVGRADLFWGASPLAAIDLQASGLAVPFRPAAARPIPSQFRDAGFAWIGFAIDPRVIIYNKARVEKEHAPGSIADMADGPYAGKGALARIDHGASAFHAASLFSLWGADRARTFLNRVKGNGTRIVAGDSEVVRLVASGEALWGFVGLDDAIGAKREAEPVDILFPERMSLGAVASPYVAVLLRGAPDPSQARGLYGYLFSSETAWQLGMNDRAIITLLPDIPKPDWVPRMGVFNVMRVDNLSVFEAFRDNGPFFEAWGSGGAAPVP